MLRRPHYSTLFAKRSYSKFNSQSNSQSSFDLSFLLSIGAAIAINSTTLYIFNLSNKPENTINIKSSNSDMPLFPCRR